MAANYNFPDLTTFDKMSATPPPPSPSNQLPVADWADRTTESNNYTNNNNYSPTFPPPLFIPCDNPRNVISPFVAEVVDIVAFVGILPVLVTCGVITNVINMVVFARQGLSDRIHLCLFSLAMSDAGFLLFLMCGKSYTLISFVDPVAGNYWQKRHQGPVLGSYLGFLVISNITTALTAVERCLCVLSPLKAAKIFKTKYLAVIIVVAAVYILVVKNTALGLKYLIVEVNDPFTNTSTFVARLAPVYLRHRTLIDVFYMHMLSLTIPIICLIVVIICTTAIIIRLKVTAKWRRKSVSNLTSVEKQEITLTRMLVTVCCVYVVCMTPLVTRALLLFTRLPGFLMSGHLCNAFKVTHALTHLLEAFNASINFHIYIRQSSCYWSTLEKMCHCVTRHCRKKGGGRT